MDITDIKKYKPAGHKIVLKYNPPTTKHGIVLPSTVKTSKQGWMGEVIAISPAADLKDAGVPDLKIGDIIDTDCILSACRTFDIGQDVYVLINDGDICGLIER